MSRHARYPTAVSREDRGLADLIRFLDALTGHEPPGGLIEIRYREPGGAMRQRFHRADRPELAAHLILVLTRRHEVYVGCAPRRRRSGGRQAIERAWALWADCDGPAAGKRLAEFEPQAAIVVRSGSADSRHAYWPLRKPLGPRDAETANRRLAHALGADPAATDAARILRPPHTRNFKHKAPAPVVLECLSDSRYLAAEIVAGLHDPRRGAARNAEPGPALRRDDALRGIEPAVYVEALTGQAVGRDRKVHCAFHEDSRPSLHVYEGPEGGWYCFSCRRGTSVYDLAGPLWGLSTRGHDFIELRGRLTALLLRRSASSTVPRTGD